MPVQRAEGAAESLVVEGQAVNSPFADPSEVRHYLRPQLSGLHRMLSHLPGASPPTPQRQPSASLDASEDPSDCLVGTLVLYARSGGCACPVVRMWSGLYI